ncbi:hypothetical protein ACLM5H_19370 [Fredinandcohnia humi]
MPYESKIRPFNTDRVTKNTTISQSILKDLKQIADLNEMPLNQLIAEGIDYVLQNYKKPSDFKSPDKPLDRVQMGTTFSESQYNMLKERARKLHTHTNTLLELGMKHVIQNHLKT